MENCACVIKKKEKLKSPDILDSNVEAEASEVRENEDNEKNN
ncbi:MAG: hypothetical protein ACRC6Z_05430 [Cetobacterium sp.]